MADRNRRAPGGVAGARLRVAVRADSAVKARVVAMLNDVPDIAVVDDDRTADIHVIIGAPVPAALDTASKPILLVEQVDGDAAFAAVRAGARAVLPVDVKAMTLAHAVRAVAAGLVVLHADSIHENSGSDPAFLPENDSLTAALEPLTERELQVLQRLADGLSNKAIARALAISGHTVKFHLAAIYAKLDAKSRAEALAQGIRFGLVHL